MKNKTYYISVDLHSPVKARSETEALKKANKEISEGCYTLNIVDTDKD